MTYKCMAHIMGTIITSGCAELKKYAKRGFSNIEECIKYMMGEEDEAFTGEFIRY